MASTTLHSNGISAHHGIKLFQEELRRLQQEAVEDMSQKLKDLVDQVETSVGTDVINLSEKKSPAPTPSPAKSKRKKESLPPKEFRVQDSVVTELLRDKHFKSLQNITIAAMIVWVVVATITEVMDAKSLSAILPCSQLLQSVFYNYKSAIVYWLGMMGYALLIYPFCHFWHDNRPDTRKTNRFDYAFFVVYAGYFLYLLQMPWDILFINRNVGSACACAIAFEQARLLMKIHSFFREVVGATFNSYEDDAIDDNTATRYTFPNFSR